MRRRKLRIVRIIITEIIVMALGVICCIMPMPWRLIVPIIIGTRSILIKAHIRLKEEPLLPEEIKTTSLKGNSKIGRKREKGKAVKNTTKKSPAKSNPDVGNGEDKRGEK